MKKILLYLCIGIGVVAALAVISFIALFFVGDHAISAQRTACLGSEDFVSIRSQLKKSLEDGIIDKAVMDRENKSIEKAAEVCASGDKNKSRALLIGILIDASLQSDEVYWRKANGGRVDDEKVSKRQDRNRQGDPENTKNNPSPVKRYELVATSNSPGSWDSVKGVLTFVVNKECAPENYYSRGWRVPNIEYYFQMKRFDEHTWKGYFFRDSLQGEDYFGLGMCHWDSAHVAANFTIHGATFQEYAVTYFDDRTTYKPQTDYFLKSSFFDKKIKAEHISGFSHYNSDTTKYPENYFTISARVEKFSE